MTVPAVPENETERLAALASCEILDTRADPDFDMLAKLAATLTGAPAAVISLVDRDRDWFKAKFGTEGSEAPREISFCGHAILGADPLVVEDALEDPRFADNPMVLGGPEIRFYAGVPLITPDGFALGTLCVSDTKPRTLSPEQLEALVGLSRRVVAQLELRRKIAALERESNSHQIAERTAAEDRGRYWRIFHSSLDAIVAVDQEGLITEINPAAEELFGYRPDEVLGTAVAELMVPPAYRDAFWAKLRQVASGGLSDVVGKRLALTAMRADGQELAVELTVSVTNRRPLALIGFIRDVSAQRRTEQDLERSHAELEAIVENSPSAIFMKDSDLRYVLVNGQAEALLGHDTSELIGRRDEDLVGVDVARERRREDARVMLGEEIRSDRTIGGEAEARTHRILSFPLRDRGGDVFGVGGIASDVTESQGEEENEREREECSERIAAAIRDDNFVLHAQPIVDLQTGNIHAYEVLLRMRGDGPDGLIMPGAFLPEAERHGLITDLDQWVVKNAIPLAKRRRIAINLSGASLGSGRLRQLIRDTIAEHEIDPHNVMLEVTETAAVEDLAAADSFVNMLTDLGFDFALDDFGTGFGSFNYLKHLNVNYLKIAMQFTRGVGDSDADRKVVESIISVAHNFDLRTIAEGVEDGETRDWLKEAGADYAQGYGLYVPAPIADAGLGQPATAGAASMPPERTPEPV